MKKHSVPYIASKGDKARNRHSNETGVVDALASNDAGNWYYMKTTGGMSIGWWHETDLAAAPKSVPSATKRKDG